MAETAPRPVGRLQCTPNSVALSGSDPRILVVGGCGAVGQAVTDQLRQRGHQRVEQWDIRTNGTAHVDLRQWAPGDGVGDWAQTVWRGDDPPTYVAWCPGVYPRLGLTEYQEEGVVVVMSVNLLSLLTFLQELVRRQTDDRAARRVVVVGSQAGATGGSIPSMRPPKQASLQWSNPSPGNTPV
jgi:NAD(P)-dependent dehydrogenase (short-subunit alcohol dehydrogenase family)